MRNFMCQSDRGSALVQAFLVSIMVLPVLAVLNQYSLIRHRSAEQVVTHSKLKYAAESGLARSRNLVTMGVKAEGSGWISDKYTSHKSSLVQDDLRWLPTQTGEKFITDGEGYFKVGYVKVRCRIVKLEPEKTDANSWYQLVAQGTNGKVTYEARCLMTLQKSFSRYARFVANGALSIRQGAEYFGEVYAYSGINCNNESPIIFHEYVATSGDIVGDADAVFHKGYSERIPTVGLPGYQDIEAIKDKLTQSSGCEYSDFSPADIIYDYKDAKFVDYFRANTGYAPLDPVNVSITFKGEYMDVTIQANTAVGNRSFTKANLEVPHNHVIWTRGYIYIRGDLSRRVTVYAQKRDVGSGGIVYITGALRYVNDSGEPQYKVYSGEGYEAAFDSTSRTWVYNAEWQIPKSGQPVQYPCYMESTTWAAPSTGNPVLGLVACRQIYLDANKLESSLQQRNLEVHALLYSAENYVEARYFTTQGYNLIINGSIVTRDTNVLASAYRWRSYLYDRNLMQNSPPRFPMSASPAFGTYELSTIPTR